MSLVERCNKAAALDDLMSFVERRSKCTTLSVYTSAEHFLGLDVVSEVERALDDLMSLVGMPWIAPLSAPTKGSINEWLGCGIEETCTTLSIYSSAEHFLGQSSAAPCSVLEQALNDQTRWEMGSCYKQNVETALVPEIPTYEQWVALNRGSNSEEETCTTLSVHTSPEWDVENQLGENVVSPIYSLNFPLSKLGLYTSNLSAVRRLTPALEDAPAVVQTYVSEESEDEARARRESELVVYTALSMYMCSVVTFFTDMHTACEDFRRNERMLKRLEAERRSRMHLPCGLSVRRYF